MKTLTLTLNLEFSEDINTDEEINEVAENVRKALVHAVDTSGLSPEGSDAYTKEISITCPWNDLEILHSVDGANNKSDKIKRIKDILDTWGATSVSEIGMGSSPVLSSNGNGRHNVSTLVEKFYVQGVEVVTYQDETEIDSDDMNYEDLPEEVINEILEQVEYYEVDMLKTEERCK